MKQYRKSLNNGKPFCYYQVISSEGKGLPASLRNLSREQVKELMKGFGDPK